MILIDTSVLVDFLEGRRTAGSRYLERLVREDAEICLTPVVIQEVLQGARDDEQWLMLEEYLGAQPRVEPQDWLRTHVAAARIFFDCRRQGYTVRSSTDCLIAQIALEHNCALLHSDRDFRSISGVRPLVTLP